MKRIDIIERDNIEELRANNISNTFYHAYKNSKRNGLGILDVDEFVSWYVDEFVENCKRFGVERFAISERSTALVEQIYTLGMFGFEVKGATKLDITDQWTGKKETKIAVLFEAK